MSMLVMLTKPAREGERPFAFWVNPAHVVKVVPAAFGNARGEAITCVQLTSHGQDEFDAVLGLSKDIAILLNKGG
jgi:hypothetical protein